MTHFPVRNGHQSITLVCKIEITSVWKGRSRVILSKGEDTSQNDNIFYFRVGPSVSCGNQHKKSLYCGLVLASGEHVTGCLVAACSLAAARGLLAAHGWVCGSRGRLYQLFTHCFLTLHQVSSLHQNPQSVLMRMLAF